MSQVPEGIYLETKQTKVGTGHTASRVTFKNYYALMVRGEQAVLFLLDDNLELTGLRETVSLTRLDPKLEHQPDMEAAFQALLPKLGPRPQAPAAPAAPAAPVPQARPVAAPPQERPVAQAPQTRPAAPVPQERPVAAPPQERQAAQAPQVRPASPVPAKPAAKEETPWWELTQKGASNLLKKD